jgi:hypothetical protein
VNITSTTVTPIVNEAIIFFLNHHIGLIICSVLEQNILSHERHQDTSSLSAPFGFKDNQKKKIQGIQVAY